MNMMKRVFLFLLCVLSLTACKFLDKDDNSSGRVYYYAYQYRPRGNMLDMCDITVTYQKSDGLTKTDTLTAENWVKTDYLVKGEIHLGYTVNLTAKDSCIYYEKDTTFHFHHYFNYDLSVNEGIWTNQWDQMYEVKCPITRDSLQHLLDLHFDRRGVDLYMDKNFTLVDKN